jgi:hypothetical protein
MKTVNIAIPRNVVLKLSVYRDLTGKPKDIDAAFLIESIVNEKLLSLLGMPTGAAVAPVYASPSTPIAPEEAAEGLGDEIAEEDTEAEKKEMADLLTNMDKRSAITEADLERDMQVDDPAKEAKADATSIRILPDQDAEEAFDFIQPKRQGKRRGAKVSMMSEYPNDVS